RNIAPDRARLDVVDGSAGTVLGLIAAGNAFDRSEFIDIARLHADMLLEAATRSDDGGSWSEKSSPQDTSRLGYAHGQSGIATALFAISKNIGEDAYSAAGREALRFERTQSRTIPHDPQSNAGDGAAIATPGGPRHSIAWCEGETAVGFSRLQLRS